MRPVLHFALYSLGLAAPETQTTVAERDCLARHAAGKKRAAEIGVWHGVTTCRIAQAVARDGVVYAVDNYIPGRLGFSFQYRVAKRNTRAFRNRVRFVLTTGKDAAAQFIGEHIEDFEFLFIDGDHSYEGIRTDWEAWSPLIAKGGVVALHDSRSCDLRRLDEAGSCIYTREVILKDERFKLIDEVDSVSVLQRV